MKHPVRPLSPEAAARASWVLLQQLVAQAVTSGDLAKEAAISAIGAAMDTMPDPPAQSSQDAVKMLENFRELVEQVSPRPD